MNEEMIQKKNECNSIKKVKENARSLFKENCIKYNIYESVRR